MLKGGILNPQLLSLLARVRHTNLLVIADRGFPYWPEVETVDISLVDDIPTVVDVLSAVMPMCDFGAAYMAEEFLSWNDDNVTEPFLAQLAPLKITFEPHEGGFKRRVPKAVGLIRTGGTIHFSNVILQSA